ncbi:hypothetical protein [Limnohabitans sp.]|uniref:hypothetical protein n=1 Tax=Limnohabitans sp. TaxID=1907725 RepID=UPI0026193F12|nr:hypothetical protein [Limnohabitans sp.]
MQIIFSAQGRCARTVDPKVPQIMQPTGQLQGGIGARLFSQPTTLPCVLQLGDGLTRIHAITVLAVEVQNGFMECVHSHMMVSAHEIFMTKQSLIAMDFS